MLYHSVAALLGSAYFTVSFEFETSGSIAEGGAPISLGAAIANLEGKLCTKQDGTIESFYSLIRTPPGYTWSVCIYRRKCPQTYRGASECLTAPDFKDVYSDFLKWIVSVCNTSKFVITAHNGYVCDFLF